MRKSKQYKTLEHFNIVGVDRAITLRKLYEIQEEYLSSFNSKRTEYIQSQEEKRSILRDTSQYGYLIEEAYRIYPEEDHNIEYTAAQLHNQCVKRKTPLIKRVKKNNLWHYYIN